MFSNNMAALSADKNGLAGHEMRLGINLKRFRYSGAPECLHTELPSSPAPPSAQADWTLLGPADRHVRRLAPPPDRRSKSRVGPGIKTSVCI
jgi:hypothetical protein